MLLAVSLRRNCYDLRFCSVPRRYPGGEHVLLQAHKRTGSNPHFRSPSQCFASAASSAFSHGDSSEHRHAGISEVEVKGTDEPTEAQRTSTEDFRTPVCLTADFDLGVVETRLSTAYACDRAPVRPNPGTADITKVAESSRAKSFDLTTNYPLDVFHRSQDLQIGSPASENFIASSNRQDGMRQQQRAASINSEHYQARLPGRSDSAALGHVPVACSVAMDLRPLTEFHGDRRCLSFAKPSPHNQTSLILIHRFSWGTPISTQVLRAISFAEALAAFRSGDADLLDPVSVLAGWYQRNDYRLPDIQQSGRTRARIDAFDVLLTGVIIRRVIRLFDQKYSYRTALSWKMIICFVSPSSIHRALYQEKYEHLRYDSTYQPRLLTESFFWWTKRHTNDWAVAEALEPQLPSERLHTMLELPSFEIPFIGHPPQVSERLLKLVSRKRMLAKFTDSVKQKYPELPPSIVEALTAEQPRLSVVVEFIRDVPSRQLVLEAVRFTFEIRTRRQKSLKDGLERLDQRPTESGFSKGFRALRSAIVRQTDALSRLRDLLSSLKVLPLPSLAKTGCYQVREHFESVNESNLTDHVHSNAAERPSENAARVGELDSTSDNVSDVTALDNDNDKNNSILPAYFDKVISTHERLSQPFQSWVPSLLANVTSETQRQEFMAELASQSNRAIRYQEYTVLRRGRRGLVSHFDRKILAVLRSNLGLLRELAQSAENPLKRTRETMQLPEQVQNALDRGKVNHLSTLRPYSYSLPPRLRLILWQKVTDGLVARLQRVQRVGPRYEIRSVHEKLQEIATWLRTQGAPHELSYESLLARRAVNQFTGQRHKDVEDEIRAVERWQKTELQKHRESTTMYPSSSSIRDRQSREELKRQREMSDVKLTMVARELKKLKAERQSTIASAQTHADTIPESSSHIPGALGDLQIPALQPPTLPHSILHYILQDFVYLFKGALFTFGQRAFPGVMSKCGWNSVERVSIMGFVEIMRTNEDMSERISVSENQFESLRLLRNAHAHEISDFDATHILALLDDLYDIAETFRFGSLKGVFDTYRDLIKGFVDELTLKQKQLRTRIIARLKEFDAKHETRQRQVEKQASHSRRSLRQIREDQRLEAAKDERRMREIKRGWMTRAEYQVVEAGRELKRFTLEREVTRMLRLLPASDRAKVVQNLQNEFGTTTLSDVKNTSVNSPTEASSETQEDYQQELPAGQTFSAGTTGLDPASPYMDKEKLASDDEPDISSFDVKQHSKVEKDSDSVTRDLINRDEGAKGDPDRYAMPASAQDVGDIDPSYSFLLDEDASVSPSSYDERDGSVESDPTIPDSLNSLRITRYEIKAPSNVDGVRHVPSLDDLKPQLKSRTLLSHLKPRGQQRTVRGLLPRSVGVHRNISKSGTTLKIHLAKPVESTKSSGDTTQEHHPASPRRSATTRRLIRRVLPESKRKGAAIPAEEPPAQDSSNGISGMPRHFSLWPPRSE
ncbi:hypothetical protein FB567DRAFT_541252 [Paraphoma chrysanthemicola]|uniref:Uncharacterized protein n=1 Tax=Paraphoma chrysanthemicola TaxID=798071 RepID=A0A8K0QS64_9PLEO|nr:hypothetical protein FB567DRAFT_541252 [Paraphoma chrysanthemicola]